MQHIAFIMDGNRRWAKTRGRSSLFGHEQGGETLEMMLSLCKRRFLPYVSMWTLSKENLLERSPLEIEGLYALIRKKLPELVEKLIRESIRLEIVGNLELLPEDIRTLLDSAHRRTITGHTLTLILALAYGGQDEIVRGVRTCLAAGIDPESLNETGFLSFLDTGRFPPPDLIIRTGGRIRHSGYFLYQSAYSEYYFTDTLWPDFGEEDLDNALSSYRETIRNYGK